MANNRKVGTGRAAATEADDVTIVDPETGTGLGTTANPFKMAAADGAALATEATLDDVKTALETPATSLPHFALDATKDQTHAFVTSSSSGEQDMVTATASQTIRLYGFTITAAAATVVELRDGASGTALKTIVFPAAGAYVYDQQNGRPWLVCTSNTKLVRNSTVATLVTIDFDYVKAA